MKDHAGEIVEYVNARCKFVLESKQTFEILGGHKFWHKLVSFRVKADDGAELLKARVIAYLSPYLPSSLVIWRVKPEIEQRDGYTSIYLRLYLDGLVDTHEEGSTIPVVEA